MKKKLVLITSIVFIIIITFTNCNVSYCNEIYAPKSKLIYDLMTINLSSISSEIKLTSKNIITESSEEYEKNEEKYLKDINYIISNINYLIADIESKKNEYKDDLYVLNGLYASDLILNEYRYSLTSLLDYTLARNEGNKEGEYINLEAFFIVKNQADTKLNAAKSILNAQ